MMDHERVKQIQAIVNDLNDTLARAAHDNNIMSVTTTKTVLNGNQEVITVKLFKRLST